MVLLAVCANASRLTWDERVMMVDHDNPDLSGPSAGWMFIAQTPLIRKSIVDQATIIDLQYYAVRTSHCPACSDIDDEHLPVGCVLLPWNVVTSNWVESSRNRDAFCNRNGAASANGGVSFSKVEVAVGTRETHFLARSLLQRSVIQAR
jgi:hypothetical protein